VGTLRTNLTFTAVAVASVLVSAAVMWGYIPPAPSANTLRIGFFPNVTHAQPLIGLSTGAYQQGLGDEFTIQAMVFNAGPTAIQALLLGQVELVFVGPSPTLSGVALAGPDAFRVIAGAASGGALFVIQPHLDLIRDEDFMGKRFAAPEYGNTQDVALRHYLHSRNHTTLAEGGAVDVINPGNAGILSEFRQGRIDGAWVPEPWASRLVREANGKVFIDERNLWPNRTFVTTHIVTTNRYLREHADVLTRFLRAHVNVTLDLQSGDSSYLRIVNSEILNLTGSQLAPETISAAFANLYFTYDPIAPSLATYLVWSKQLGFVRDNVRADSLYDLDLLNSILQEMGLPEVTVP
jgi:NitT/TauT family transport system substrate-binding protein